MCGFVAIFSPERIRSSGLSVETMTRTLVHRGPDSEGFFADDHVSMGFRRLSILDLSTAGDQPMVDQDGRFVLVFNGEVYNYVELRKELAGLGHRFRSSGDAEVLLNAYKQWGPRCVDRFNGMFAFLIYDKVQQQVFGARDRFGIKPLYYTEADGHVIFASEIKALRASGLCGKSINYATVQRYLIDGLIDESDETFFSDIRKVPAGTRFELDDSRVVRFEPYWDLECETETIVGDPVERFRELFDSAVQLRMRSDVPVGVSLSGGLDSTSILCAMASQLRSAGGVDSDRLMAFSFHSNDFDERSFVEETLAETGAQLHRISDDGLAFWGQFADVLRMHDEPVHSMTPIAGYKVMATAAANGVKVVLGGQGADEVFGGYSSYFGSKRQSLIQQSRYAQFYKETQAYARQSGDDLHSLLMSDLLLNLKLRFKRFRPYRNLSQRRRYAALKSNEWFSDDFKEGVCVDDQESPDKDLQSVLLAETTKYPLPLYLRIEDRNSMAHSVEARLPFLDYRLVKFAFSLPDDWRVGATKGKILLREAGRGRIPEVVRSRAEKMGFPTPWTRWFREDLYEPIGDLLSTQRMRERGMFNADFVRCALEKHRSGEADFAEPLFRIAQFELWADLFNEV